MSLDSILFVDDDPIANFQHTKLAGKLKVAREIIVKTNGEDALSFINERYWTRKSLPTIVLLDLNMPLMNGMEFLHELRNSDLLGVKNIPIAIVANSFGSHEITLLQNLGYCFVTKPLTEAKLTEAISNTLFKSISG